ncbi:hypothetical protein P3X46_031270 [Hevea brasiliensis]|uniref:Uncharacterized protein n=1 Tax=Hevea brasiliensis TaxID=3981 RepID=A0ABQ9KJS3_HEVBR|nr:uncharacterized protein LOC110638238 [Hevea brasiliensis]KAJ9140651.1 hypothetical protein P3X46_031270 [Hevea brasiliensis]
MYVTRPLSMYQRDPSALSLPPPEGPNSGILVIQDEEAYQPTCCFGLCKSNLVRNLPFPQNKNLKVHYTRQTGKHQQVYINRVLFIPVLNLPLLSNQYYCIERKGRHKGAAYRNSKEEDMKTYCFCSCISDLEPLSLDPQDIYQKFEIRHRKWGGFVAKSVPSDGFPPNFLRRKDWGVYASSPPRELELKEAPGLDKTVRARLPDFNFPLSYRSPPPVVVGRWYCPFMFIRDGALKDQMDNSRYYEMTLEQQWQQIFACESNYNEGNAVTVDVTVETEVVAVAGKEAMLQSEKNVIDGVMWFRSPDDVGGEAIVGLSLAVVERMKWEQERFGWIGAKERQVRVKRVEEFGGRGGWRRFGCYVLVERFALKRMDGSLLLTYDFKHTQHIMSKWE